MRFLLLEVRVFIIKSRTEIFTFLDIRS